MNPGVATMPSDAAHRSPWRWIALVFFVWGALVVLSLILRHLTGTDQTLCLFRRITGEPCATCGGTRATIHLAHGEFVEALRLNPFVTFAWFVVPIGSAWLSVRRWRGRPGVSRSVENRLWIAAGLVLAANWVYLLIERPL